jgi:manganese-dependent ADP-ribose/CDP-alcohol diphosphatase
MGLIADIQYAPIPDGYSYSGQARFYKHALEVARQAAMHFEKEKVELVLNLGDIVDGKCQEIALHGGEPFTEDIDPGMECVGHVMDALSKYRSGPILHAYGNHCLYNLDRPSLQRKLGIPFVKEPCGDLVGYRSHGHKKIRFVILDSYDVATMRRCSETSQKYRQAANILRKNNPNYPAHENSPAGLTGVTKRFVAFNGGVGKVQLEWLQSTLQQAREANEKVIVLSHQPILPASTSPVCLIWNYQQVLSTLRRYKDVVVASFSGHAHKGGYDRDPVSGIHFRVFEAALENADPDKTYAFIDMYEDRLSVRGIGNCKSASYFFDHQPLPEMMDPSTSTESASGQSEPGS